MTITLNVRVGGDYRATVVPTVEGQPAGEPIIVDGPSGDKQIYFQHGKTNTFVITEESLHDIRAAEGAAIEGAALEGTGATAADVDALAKSEDLDGLGEDAP